MSFTTFNQFDKRFDDFTKFGQDRTACPLFGIITCHNFMKNGQFSKKQHENNIYASVTNYMVNDIPKYMSFDELLLFSSNLNQNQVSATTPELITSNILGYEHIFKLGDFPEDHRYCILFLKNRNYIPILCNFRAPKSADEAPETTYAIRDCHENTQRIFNDFALLRSFLDKTYQFEQMTIVDGVLIAEFSNIEFLVIEDPFTIKVVDPDLFDHTIEEDKEYTEYKEEPTIIVSQNNSIDVPKFDFDYQLALSLQNEDTTGDDYVNFI
jgi:hypothetical protein